MYQVYDKKTGYNVGKAVSTLTRAKRKCDRLDNEYGAYRYAFKYVAVSDKIPVCSNNIIMDVYVL